MRPTAITFVRLSEDETKQALRQFMHKHGLFSERIRVPRGCDPIHVVSHLTNELKPDADPVLFRRAVAVGRFYESRDAVPQVAKVFDSRPGDRNSLLRACYAVQFVADLGTPDQVEAANAFFEAMVVPHPDANKIYSDLLETRLTLAPVGTTDPVEARITRDLQAAATTMSESEQALYAHDALAAVMKNDVPRTRRLEAVKAEIAAMPPGPGRVKRSRLYTVRPGEPSHPYLVVWCARGLRADAMAEGQQPVISALRACLMEGAPPAPDQAGEQATISRAAEAVVYMGDDLSVQERAWYHGLDERFMNFLWDDLPGLIPPPPKQP